MAHTHKTMPVRVKFAHGTIRPVPHHDHRDGTCDLPDQPIPFTEGPRTRCIWTNLADGRNLWCGCKTCTQYQERRAERRRDRHDAKRSLRADRFDLVGSGRA